jgi:hypothetical protein
MAGKAAWTTADMADAIRETAGIKTAAARRLGCNVSTIDRYQNIPRSQLPTPGARAGIADMAESVLVRRLNAGKSGRGSSLTTFGRDRGSTPRADAVHEGGRHGLHTGAG